MKVNVIDALAREPAIVHDQAVARFGDRLIAGDIPGCDEELADQRRILLVQCFDGRDVAPGNDEDVRRRTGLDVPERDDVIVFMNNVRGCLTGGDLAENAVGLRHGHSPSHESDFCRLATGASSYVGAPTGSPV